MIPAAVSSVLGYFLCVHCNTSSVPPPPSANPPSEWKHPPKCNLVVGCTFTQALLEACSSFHIGEAVGGLCIGMGRVRFQLCTDCGALRSVLAPSSSSSFVRVQALLVRHCM